MKRPLALVPALALPILLTSPASAAVVEPQGRGTAAPSSVAVSNPPANLYVEWFGERFGYVLAGGDSRNAWLQMSEMQFHADGSYDRLDVDATLPARALTVAGNLSSATLSPTDVTVTRATCVESGCTWTTTVAQASFTVTATGPVDRTAGSQGSSPTPDGKRVVAGTASSRTGTIALQLGTQSWTVTDDGWVTGAVSLSDSAMVFVNRGGY